MAEWSNATVLKTVRAARLSWVRILLPPPASLATTKKKVFHPEGRKLFSNINKSWRMSLEATAPREAPRSEIIKVIAF